MKLTIGNSYQGRPIKCVRIGNARPIIILQYGIHAREYITTALAYRQIANTLLSGARATCYFIPSANPDGLEIAKTTAPLYKANARGVDLNLNFDADFGRYATSRVPSGEGYAGEYPFSERETQAIRDLTLEVMPDITVSYHAKGEVVYYDYNTYGREHKRQKYYGDIISRSTGYPLLKSENSSGGYKDWCVKRGIAAYTVEVGSDSLSHPIGIEQLDIIYEQNKNVIEDLISGYKIYEGGV